MGKNKKGVQYRILNFKEEYKEDKLKGKAIDIKSVDWHDKDFNKLEDGIMSPLFGTDISDENAGEERYSCKCGKYTGLIHENEMCEECHSKVRFIDIDLEIFGYMNLEKYYLLNPILAEKLKSYMGNKYIDVLISKYRLDKNGRVIEDTEREYHDPNFKFNGLGMMDLKDNYEEILQACYSKDKHAKFEELMEYKDEMFVQNIPIYHAALRPMNISDKIYITPINNQLKLLNKSIQKINSLVDSEGNVKKDDLLEVSKNLWKAQKRIGKLFENAMDMVKGKRGLVRGSILGGRVELSAQYYSDIVL